MTVLVLMPVLDLSAAMPLRALLVANRGADLDVDASNVERLGGLCLQLLVGARAAWEAGGHKFQMVNLSEPCRDALRLAQANTALGMEE